MAALSFRGEHAAGGLVSLSVIGHTLATVAFAGAGRGVSAATVIAGTGAGHINLLTKLSTKDTKKHEEK